jgi:methionyl-tRNA synthetase
VFTPESFVERVNSDLANDLGNLLNRTVAMINKYFDGKIPTYIQNSTPFDQGLVQLTQDNGKKVEDALEKMEFSVALTAIWQIVSRTNKYIDETQPWVLAKDEDKKEQLGSVLYHLVESLRHISIMVQPFMTQTPKKIWNQLGLIEGEITAWESLYTFGKTEAGTTVQTGEPIFPRLDVEQEVENIVKDMGGTYVKESNDQKEEKVTLKAPEVDEITIDDFTKLDLRVGQIIGAEKIKKADKLLKIQLDLGYEKRQVVSGIAQYYTPDELIGQKVICIANLKPIKLRGEDSKGMILAGSEGDQLKLATIDQNLPNGSKVK